MFEGRRPKTSGHHGGPGFGRVMAEGHLADMARFRPFQSKSGYHGRLTCTAPGTDGVVRFARHATEGVVFEMVLNDAPRIHDVANSAQVVGQGPQDPPSQSAHRPESGPGRDHAVTKRFRTPFPFWTHFPLFEKPRWSSPIVRNSDFRFLIAYQAQQQLTFLESVDPNFRRSWVPPEHGHKKRVAEANWKTEYSNHRRGG